MLAAMAAVALVALGSAGGAAAATMVVQPDGKIVVLGSVWPQAGAIARLNADGSLDSGFAEKGFLLDRRVPGMRALALQSDGRVVGAAVGGFLLTRYLGDGSPDPAFAGGGVGGSYEADQVQFAYGNYGPVAVAIQPGGAIVVAGIHEVNGGGATDGWIKRYDGAGAPLDTVGQLPLPGGPASAATLTSLLERPDGSFLSTGSTYLGDGVPPKWFLARFVPGSGGGFDAGFGAGSGLVQPAVPSSSRPATEFRAIAGSGGKTLVAGRAAGTFLLVRFNGDGTVDTGFGQNGFVTPTVTGKTDRSAGEGAETWASALAALPGGGALLAGGTSQWGRWDFSKTIGPFCTECPQPMLARFDAAGNLDPGFGSGELLRMLKPDGTIFQGAIDAVAALPDGKILVKGAVTVDAAQSVSRPFVARLNPDGSYDPSFGDRGLATVRFPCTDQREAELRQAGCVGSAGAKLRLTSRRGRRPALSLRVWSTAPWAGIEEATLSLPRGLGLRRGFMSKLRVVPIGSDGADVDVGLIRSKRGETSLLLRDLGDASRLRVTIRRGGLVGGGLPRRRLQAFQVGLQFEDSRWGTYAGHQTLMRRPGG